MEVYDLIAPFEAFRTFILFYHSILWLFSWLISLFFYTKMEIVSSPACASRRCWAFWTVLGRPWWADWIPYVSYFFSVVDVKWFTITRRGKQELSPLRAPATYSNRPKNCTFLKLRIRLRFLNFMLRCGHLQQNVRLWTLFLTIFIIYSLLVLYMSSIKKNSFWD